MSRAVKSMSKNEEGHAAHYCVNCLGLMSADSIYEAAVGGHRVCQSCAENIMESYHYARSGSYVLRENPIQKQGYRKACISEKLRWEIFNRDQFSCVHCGSTHRLTVDHIQPESKDGDQSPKNLQTLCRSCNSKKGVKQDRT